MQAKIANWLQGLSNSGQLLESGAPVIEPLSQYRCKIWMTHCCERWADGPTGGMGEIDNRVVIGQDSRSGPLIRL